MLYRIEYGGKLHWKSDETLAQTARDVAVSQFMEVFKKKIDVVLRDEASGQLWWLTDGWTELSWKSFPFLPNFSILWPNYETHQATNLGIIWSMRYF